MLSAMGALEMLESRAAPLTGMTVHAPSGGKIHGEFVAQHGFRGFRDRGLGIRRELLDAIVLDRARAGGVRVEEGVKVEDVLRDATGRVSGVRVRTDAGHRDIASELVIGADGLRSVVARRVGLAHTARWPKRIALVAHYRGVAGMTSLGEMHVTHRGYLGLASVNDGVTNVALVVNVHHARDMLGDPEAFLHAWIARHPTLAVRLASAVRVSPVRAVGPFASRARRPYTDGVALVGDAADFFDPFTGEGIYSALRGGELLAPFAVDVVHAASRRDPAQERRALRAYARARHDAFAGKWRVERAIGVAVAAPSLMNGAARVLGHDRDLSDLIIGVTGDFVPASAVLAPRVLLRVARAVVRAMNPFATQTPSLTASPTVSPHVHRR